MMAQLTLNKDLCTGCKICELICTFHHYEVNNPRKARLRIESDEKEIYFKVRVCTQCRKPKCVEACPEGALSKNDEGITVLDNGKCNNCLICIDACPFGAILYHPDTGILKCDLCETCIPECPNRALAIKKTTSASAK